MLRFESPKDFWPGLMFLGVGLFFAIWASMNYQTGSSVRMGPGYFPTVLGGLMAVLGAIIFAGSFVIAGSKLPAFHVRPLVMILVACIAYGYLMKPLGLMLATALMVFIASVGGHEFLEGSDAARDRAGRFLGPVFVKGLTLPFPLWPDRFN